MEETELLCLDSPVDSESSVLRMLERELVNADERIVPTPFGDVKVALQGQPNKPPIVTCHDIGLNYVTCFQQFFNSSEMKPLLEHFAVYHLTLPGQHNGANVIAPAWKFSSMQDLTIVVDCLLTFFNLKQIIGFGVGAGANVLARFALLHPSKVEGLVLLNCTSSQCGWAEWGYQKIHGRSLKSGNLTGFVEDYLLWHWFGRQAKESNSQLVNAYREHIKTLCTANLSTFIDAYINRTDLQLVRVLDERLKEKAQVIRCPVLLVTGDRGPLVDETIDMNSKLDPALCSFVRFTDCGGMILEEQPVKMVDAFRLFLQGLGYVPFFGQRRIGNPAV